MVPGAVVKKGTFLYSGAVECDLCIVLSPVRFGSGDYEDSPEFANDVESPTYYVYFGSTIERGKFNAGAGGYPSLSEAMAAVEHAAGIGPTVRWGHDGSAQVEQEKNQ